MPFLLYLATNAIFASEGLVKHGSTEDCFGRLRTYLTGCPPGRQPSHDLYFASLWETTAQTRAELYRHEEEVQERFIKRRMMRRIPRDTEWFNFGPSSDSTKEFNDFIVSRPWFKRRVPFSEITPTIKTAAGKFLKEYYGKNLSYVESACTRNELLTEMQKPIIGAVRDFIAGEERAGYVIAPCGAGKTRIACLAAVGCARILVCCPSKAIQEQWRITFSGFGGFSPDEIHLVGDAGTTKIDFIWDSLLARETFCVITTNISSHLLVGALSEDALGRSIDLLIVDEAHHMAGVLPDGETGEGRTRRLMQRAVELGIKRLSLTFTPRIILESCSWQGRASLTSETGEPRSWQGSAPLTSEAGDAGLKWMSMDDDGVFGREIAAIKLRGMISKGILPDYRLWTLRDRAMRGTGVIGKTMELIEAWNATEMTGYGEEARERHIINHLLVFAPTIEEGANIKKLLKKNTADAKIFHLKGGDDTEKCIMQFEAAERAIIVNCKVLGEGVDIPRADAVAVMYPKKSRGEIVQMILRPGRWYKGKAIFHILIPILDDEDISGFEEVLCALAANDKTLYDEVVFKSGNNRWNTDEQRDPEDPQGIKPELVVSDVYDSNVEDVRRCFANVRRKLFTTSDGRRVQQWCVEQGITTKLAYDRLRLETPELPEDPRGRGETWYGYLNPTVRKLALEDFARVYVVPNGLRVDYEYDEWRNAQSADIKTLVPSVQNISDGYFGANAVEFNALVVEFFQVSRPQRR